MPEPDPDFTRITGEFQSFGGDVPFLTWLSLTILRPRPHRVVHQTLVKAKGLTHRLRQSMGVPTVRQHFPEVEAISLSLVRLEMRIAMTIDLDCQRQQRLSRRLKLRGNQRGHPITRSDLYSWLGALVPYTALCCGGTPKWAWIDRWLDYRRIEVPEGGCQKFWSKSVVRQWEEKGKINRDLALLLEDMAQEYLFYLDIRRPTLEAPAAKRMDSMRASEYRRMIKRHLPFVKSP